MLFDSSKVLLFRYFVLCIGIAPGIIFAWLWVNGGLGANPAEAAVHFTGKTGLVLLLITIAFSPAFRLTGWRGVMAARRQIGLWAFFWLVVHMLTWFGWDQYWDWQWIWHDIWALHYVRYGVLALLLLVPLAVTSFQWFPQHMGWKAWHWLHRFIYLSAGLGIYHFWELTRADYLVPFVFGSVLAFLVVFRLIDALIHRQ
ncbi:ferric reductase-like transmembrane domain-containing protein [Halomonas qinghailakensis]|uniref:Protein-methionine-sulfoxide reductase heme-binding subunit MsrQ n=2 Tax=Halomonas TaxID=2745 RepID=A0AA46TS45_9GAMM|nr:MULTISPECIES: ferric reductase-like transmembrane domain-containing protein [Halomonas]UYO74552.1 ferric reductase-like transmembrane domain-containing protein [Halomonas sp. ZZQ-149]UYV20507.1 ferric reductase-like transmembrane domain-containing protein [Halomonas qaidamensis]